MKKLIVFLYILFLSMVSFAQGNLILTMSDTVLTAEQVAAKNSNPTVLMYPLNMKDKIPQMQCNQTEGLGPFSVAADRQVYFSPGNLQYNAALGSHQCADGTTQPGTWRFAEHQWDIVGIGYGQTDNSYVNVIGGTVENGDNTQISSTYDGWIDLFGWGTSGWNSGANVYQPWATSSSYADYYPGGSYNNGLTGEYANADWGVYNQIGSDAPGTWRTLTYEEWKYVYSGRANASNLCGQATVNGVTGVILLPDDWLAPDGITFTAGTSVGFTANQYDLSQWEKMEDVGAVFLPAAGYRDCDGSVAYVGSSGNYWSSTPYGSDDALGLYFLSSGVHMGSSGRCYGISVRLVQSIPQQKKAGRFSISTDTKVEFAPGNLQYNAALGSHQCADGTTQPGTWRFAEHQWDIVGIGYGKTDTDSYNYIGGTVENGDNNQISSTYDGWIDLFSWGTSGWNSGANVYQPWVTSSNYDSDYNIGGSYNNGMTGEYANADWGVYNKIGSDAPGTWRTLTYEEWRYVYSGRANAGNLCGQATVNGVTGLILLPDDWVAPDGITFTAGTSVGFTANQYDLSQWEKMEDAGAVFLPAAGYRDCDGSVGGVGSGGSYWSSTPYGSGYAWHLGFNSSRVAMGYYDRCYGRSVRLVR